MGLIDGPNILGAELPRFPTINIAIYWKQEIYIKNRTHKKSPPSIGFF